MKSSRVAREPEDLELVVSVGDQQIRFRSSLLESLRSDVIEGFRAVKHGGIEVGGVLFGVDRQGSIEVHAYRELACEHLFGPAFRLSTDDDERLAALVNSPPKQSSFPAPRAVGWYCSHCRTELAVLEADVSLHERHFPAPSAFLLLLKPASTFVVEGAVFQPPRAGSRAASNTEPQILLKPRHEPHSPQKKAAEPIPEPPPPASLQGEPSPKPRAYRNPWLLGAGIMCLLLAGIFLTQWILSMRRDSNLELQLKPVGHQLLVRWDDPIGWRRGARAAWIEIQDGDSTTQSPITGDFPEHGFLFYSPRNTRVSVHMKVKGPDARWEEKTVLAEGLSPMPVPPPPAPPVDVLADSLRQELRSERKKNLLLETTIAQMRRTQAKKSMKSKVRR